MDKTVPPELKSALNTVWDVEPRARSVRVPGLILQPLVENAIRHGIEPQTGQGKITISATRDGQLLHLQVRDNGVKSNKETKDGIGIANTRSRLRELYGEEALLTLSNSSDGGFVAAIDLPCRENENPVSNSSTTASHENSHIDRR